MKDAWILASVLALTGCTFNTNATFNTVADVDATANTTVVAPAEAPASTPPAQASQQAPQPSAAATAKVMGYLYDRDGELVKAASKVTAVAYDEAGELAYARSEDASHGSFGFTTVPPGVVVELTVEAEGYKPRTRKVRSPREGGVVYAYFGGKADVDKDALNHALEREEAE